MELHVNTTPMLEWRVSGTPEKKTKKDRLDLSKPMD